MNKKVKTLTTLVMAISLILPSVTAYAEESIDQLKDKISESQKKKEQLQGQLGSVQDDISVINAKMKKLADEITETKAKIVVVEQKIKDTDASIVKKQEQIKQTKIELEEKKKILAHNLRTMYSKGNVSFMEYLFRAGNVSDFLGRFDAIKRIARANDELYQEVRDKEAQLEREKKELDEQKATQVKQKQNLVDLNEQQVAKHTEQMKLLAELVQKENQLESDIDDESGNISEFNNQINAIIAKREAERKKREEEARRQREAGQKPTTPVYTEPVGTGQYALPVPAGSYVISSPFGWRTHPITGVQKYHNGVDFAAPYGTPIYAVDSGTVIYAGVASGYGHWVVIDHNNGYISIYGHMYANQLLVSPGQHVSKGQQIASVGSDGGSTGYHLHLSICRGQINSNFVDPMSLF